MTIRILTEQQWEQVWDALGVARGFCLPDADESVIDAAINIMRSLGPVEPSGWMIESPDWYCPLLQLNKPTQLLAHETLTPLYAAPKGDTP